MDSGKGIWEGYMINLVEDKRSYGLSKIGSIEI